MYLPMKWLMFGAVAMNNLSNVASFCAKSDTAQRNFDRGYAAGLKDGLESASTEAVTKGFWFGVGFAAVVVMIATLTYLWGKL